VIRIALITKNLIASQRGECCPWYRTRRDI
jgi:hypothetical protein